VYLEGFEKFTQWRMIGRLFGRPRALLRLSSSPGGSAGDASKIETN